MQEPVNHKGDRISEVSIEERTREEMERVLRLMGDGDRNSSLVLLRELHPVDQGEVLLELGLLEFILQ